MERKRFWYLIGIGSMFVISLILLSNVISVGEKLRDVHEYLEYAFYGISSILIYVLIVNPIRVIVFAPTFSVENILDEDNKYKVYKKATKVLLKNDILTVTDKKKLNEALGSKDDLTKALKDIFNGTIKTETNEIIIRNSKSVLVSTALSQNGNLDMLSVIVVNLKMIKEIVVLSGFRPSYPNLAKLSANVLVTSFIAEGLDDLDYSELLPTKMSETMTDLPFIKTMSHSIIGGISNATLTARVGIITRSYLYDDNKLLTKKEIRRSAYKESLKLMPIIIKDGLVFFPKGVVSIFSKPFRKKNKADKE